jgi:glycosyltransferase involved in cell wall biosynthesis
VRARLAQHAPAAAQTRHASIRHAMKVAIVHDWLDTWAGGEQCLEQILLLYPQAELFALVDFLPPVLRERIGGRRARTSFLQHVPLAHRHFRKFLPLFPRAVESLDVAGCDLVISTSHAVAKGVRTHRRQLHVCYCMSPMRYAWDLRDQYLAQAGLDRGPAGWLAGRVLDRIAAWDRRTCDRVDDFVAISQYIRDRIARCYGRDAAVVYPPVTLPPFDGRPGKRERYVTVSRLVPYKRIDLIARAFSGTPGRELVIVGDGPERARIAAAAGPNVRLLGQVGDAERDAILRDARAFLFAADEDFGIAPVEAQAAGVPVIAYGRGGARETIRSLGEREPTGVFFDEQSAEAIAAAVRRFEANEAAFDPLACRRNAERFGTERFRREFGALVAARYAAFRERCPA